MRIFLSALTSTILILGTPPLMAQDKSSTKAKEHKESEENKEQAKEEEASTDGGIKAVTENGENVILYENGTWEYQPESTAEKTKRPVNPTAFKVPADSKESIKGESVDYEIRYNKDKWQVLTKNINEMAEYSLLHKDKKAYAIVIPEGASIPMETFRNIVINNARGASGQVKILNEEERTVNGKKVILLNIRAVIQGMTFIYEYYIYSGEKSSIQIIGFTTEELFPEYKNDMEDFLNGFIVKETGKFNSPKNIKE